MGDVEHSSDKIARDLYSINDAEFVMHTGLEAANIMRNNDNQVNCVCARRKCKLFITASAV